MKTFKSLLFIICVLTSQSLEARHLLGGNMTYKCLGSNKYQFTMTIYRDGNCINCANFDTNPPIAAYLCPEGTDCDNMNQSDAFSINSTGPPLISTLPNDVTTCIDGMEISNGKNIQKATYEFELTLPLANSSYIVTYQRCCRDEILSNIQNSESQGFTVSSELTSFAQRECNNSPIIKDLKATYQVCAGELAQIYFSAKDDDSDQIIYTICSPLQGGGEILNGPEYNSCRGAHPTPPCPPPYDNIIFSAPYTPQSPFSISDNFVLNPNTGILQFTPNLIGRYLMAICLTEYRSGIPMNQSTYEFQIFSGIPNSTSSKDLIIANQVMLYPNPTNDILRLDFPQNFKPKSYSIKDLNGKSIEKSDWPNSNTIRISNLAKGIYFLYLKNEDYAFAKKFVVE